MKIEVRISTDDGRVVREFALNASANLKWVVPEPMIADGIMYYGFEFTNDWAPCPESDRAILVA